MKMTKLLREATEQEQREKAELLKGVPDSDLEEIIMEPFSPSFLRAELWPFDEPKKGKLRLFSTVTKVKGGNYVLFRPVTFRIAQNYVVFSTMDFRCSAQMRNRRYRGCQQRHTGMSPEDCYRLFRMFFHLLFQLSLKYMVTN